MRSVAIYGEYFGGCHPHNKAKEHGAVAGQHALRKDTIADSPEHRAPSRYGMMVVQLMLRLIMLTAHIMLLRRNPQPTGIAVRRERVPCSYWLRVRAGALSAVQCIYECNIIC